MTLTLRSFAFLMTMCALLGCNSQSQSETDRSDKSAVEGNDSSGETPGDRTMNFQYPGVYSGEIPCASCEAIRTKIKLTHAGQYHRTRKYLGQTEPNLFEEKGLFSWDPETQIIMLKNAEEPNQYKLERDNIIHLDMDGNKVTGDLADRYILKKRK